MPFISFSEAKNAYIMSGEGFEILKWTVNGQSRGHPISPVKYNLYFHIIFTAVKYSFFLNMHYILTDKRNTTSKFKAMLYKCLYMR